MRRHIRLGCDFEMKNHFDHESGKRLSRLKFIAHPGHRNEILGLVDFGFNLFSKALHMHIHSPAGLV